LGRPDVVLASASPARLTLLRTAGLDPFVRVSGVDEAAIEADLAAAGRTSPEEICAALAQAKAYAVLEDVRAEFPEALLIACDSVLDFDGAALGKPADEATAVSRWHAMRGREGILRTGHVLIQLGIDDTTDTMTSAVASTVVRFANLDDHTIAAYVATGEPLRVAGSFTLDGLGGAFVDRIEGDPSNVIGLSLPLLREMLTDIDVRWTDLWSTHVPTSGDV